MCVYCGGTVRATTIDHMPARIMFYGKRRPKGLEFPSCEKCNEGTKHADLVAAWIGRALPDPSGEDQVTEYRALLSALKNNIPGLLEETYMGDTDQHRARMRTGVADEGGFFRVGPLVHKYMEIFGVKLGFALSYEVTKQIVPLDGGVAVRWFSNIDAYEGKIPATMFDLLLPPETLKQGRFEVSDQFEYAWRLTDDLSMGLFFSSFRQAFGVACLVVKSRTQIDPNASPRIFAPGEIVTAI